MKKELGKASRRNRRKMHIRKRINGTADRPRMSVYRSNKHIYIQVIDDIEGKTLISTSNLEKEFKEMKSNVENAQKLGEVVGKRIKDAKINTVVFDRNGYRYHGIVKAVADGARKSGIKF